MKFMVRAGLQGVLKALFTGDHLWLAVTFLLLSFVIAAVGFRLRRR
ncbi:hypothetical protein ACH4E7_02295 [Kitasatospora sp. NPDC018058]